MATQNQKHIIDSNGLSYVWTFPTSVSTEWLIKKVTNNLKDMFLQTWLQQCRETNKACNYHLYKREFKLEIYLDNLPKCHRVFLTKIRTSNHKLPIEKGRYLNLHRDQRICNLCTLNLVCDEFHFLLEYPFLLELREKDIPKYYYKNPNFHKYSQLMAITNSKKLINLSKFVKEGFVFYK